MGGIQNVGLTGLYFNLSELQMLIKDTQMLAGSEAYGAARMAYGAAKTMGQRLGLDDVVEQLAQRYERSRTVSPPELEDGAEN
ncbi:MAG: hypothetical protein WBA10_18295 [Elainellaceae cyanobacterium]